MIIKQYLEGFIWLSLSVFLGIKSIQLELGTFSSPGPGFMPFIIALFVFLLSLILFLRINLSQKENVEKRLDLRISAVYISFFILGYVLIFKKIGFLFSTTLLMIFLFKFMGTKRWRWALGEALLATLLSYLLFGILLGLTFPAGIF